MSGFRVVAKLSGGEGSFLGADQWQRRTGQRVAEDGGGAVMKHDALIRCANGCGAMLTLQRLREGRRRTRGIICERCVAERAMGDLAAMLKLAEPERRKLAALGVSWIMGDPLPQHRSP